MLGIDRELSPRALFQRSFTEESILAFIVVFSSFSLRNGFPGLKGFVGGVLGAGVEQLENNPESKESVATTCVNTPNQTNQNETPIKDINDKRSFS